MPCDYVTALNEIQTRINETWLAGTVPIVGTVPPIIWPELDTGEAIDPSGYHARVFIQNIATGQASLAGRPSGQDLRRYRTTGAFGFQIHGPKGVIEAPSKIKLLGMLIQSALRRETLNVIFQQVTLKELPFSDGRARLFVTATYLYDQIE